MLSAFSHAWAGATRANLREADGDGQEAGPSPADRRHATFAYFTCSWHKPRRGAFTRPEGLLLAAILPADGGQFLAPVSTSSQFRPRPIRPRIPGDGGAGDGAAGGAAFVHHTRLSLSAPGSSLALLMQLGWHMSLLPIPALVAWFVLAGVLPSISQLPDGRLDDATLRLRIVQDGHVDNATCVLIHRENRGDDVVLYFVTAAHLFKRTTGEAPPRVTAINVVVDGRHAITIDPDDLVLPVGSLVDIAIFRAVVTHTTLVPQAILFEPPVSGSVFLIAGRDDAGALVTTTERVRRRATAVVAGDRDASALTGCEGAPAVGEGGMFGIVILCEPGRLPVVTLFSIAHDWISRHVPGLFHRPSLTT